MDREQAAQCPNCPEGRMSVNSGGSLWCDRCECRPPELGKSQSSNQMLLNARKATEAATKIKTGYVNPAPAAYACLYGTLKEKALALGYTLAIHGSLQRDFDLVAIPWVEDAADAETLVETIRECCGGFIVPDGTPGGRYDPTKGEFVAAEVRNPEHKPHGRLAWCINLGGNPRIDLSVMPRILKSS